MFSEAKAEISLKFDGSSPSPVPTPKISVATTPGLKFETRILSFPAVINSCLRTSENALTACFVAG